MDKFLIKKILAFGLLLTIIAGIVLWQKYQFGKEYFDKIKSILFNVNPFKAAVSSIPSFSEESGLDFSEINLENLLREEKVVGSREERLRKESQQEENTLKSDFLKNESALTEIKERLNKTAEKTEKISREVKKLLVLTEIKKEIKVIAEKTGEIEREISQLRELAEIQKKIQKIAEETKAINQEITELV